jgi:hypothetical protein
MSNDVLSSLQKARSLRRRETPLPSRKRVECAQTFAAYGLRQLRIEYIDVAPRLREKSRPHVRKSSARRIIMRHIHVLALVVAWIPAFASAQINFPKNAYYVGLGDSVAAGEGALPVTKGYVYRLYDRGAFGRTSETDFTNASVRGARSWDLLERQVPQILCSEPAQRPTVVTITAGANDVFRGDFNVAAIAQRVATSINILLNNPSVPSPVIDPYFRSPCRPLANVTILVSNYYSVPHPNPAVFAQLDALLRGFDQALRFAVGQVPVPAGSRVAIVDLYTPSLDRQGLVLVDRRLGISPGAPPPFNFDVHPTNLGHAFIAGEFESVWRELED